MARYNDVFAEILPLFKELEPQDRVEVLSLLGDVYCLECGDEQPKRGRCQCWNDEAAMASARVT